MIEKFKEAFREEATELLNNLEHTLLELEANPTDTDTISAVFRTMHTIKGSSSMFGFDEISRFTHEVESIMDLLREGAFIADRKLIDLTLRARDLVSSMLSGVDEALRTEAASLVSEFKAHSAARTSARAAELAGAREGSDTLPLAAADAASAAAPAPSPAEAEGAPAEAPPVSATGLAPVAAAPAETFRIHFVPDQDVFLNGTKPLLLLDELRSLGAASIVPLTEKIPPLSELDPEKCYVGWDITLTTDKGEDAVRDVFIFVQGSGELTIEKVSPSEELIEETPKKIGEILVERGVTTRDRIQSVVESQKKLGEILVQEKVATSEQVKSALDEQEQLKRLKESKQQELGTSSIRVASDKLDALVDLVGELVTLQARLSRTASDLRDGSLSLIAEQFERLMSQLRGNTMSIRMLPIGSTFSKFRRVVRDLSADLGKETELVTEGAETELDKTVIEKLNDPLVHIIRNSVDHGIEKPEVRVAAGKPRTGTVTLSAKHSGAHDLIEVWDDGAGLNTERILAKAIERGIVPAGASLSEQELFQLIFAPGFSTAQVVTSVSGRGVGMDVVKREIDSLGGSVSVSSTRGEGSRITLRIPLTLAIIEGLLVRVGAEHFVIPLSSVDGCIELKREDRVTAADGRSILTYRNEILPYVGVRDLYAVPGDSPDIEQIVVVNAHEARVGFVVDQVVGDYQTVIKPLGRMFKSAEGISGATILGDGTVALIVDVNRLSMTAQREEIQRLKRDRDVPAGKK
jgi:two-component system chemotaxis sensor kinase CheA